MSLNSFSVPSGWEFLLSEVCNVAYQIKGPLEKSNVYINDMIGCLVISVTLEDYTKGQIYIKSYVACQTEDMESIKKTAGGSYDLVTVREVFRKF